MLRVLIGFNSGRYEANDLSAWLASNPVDVLATNLGLPRDTAARLPRRTAFMVRTAGMITGPEDRAQRSRMRSAIAWSASA